MVINGDEHVGITKPGTSRREGRSCIFNRPASNWVQFRIYMIKSTSVYRPETVISRDVSPKHTLVPRSCHHELRKIVSFCLKIKMIDRYIPVLRMQKSVSLPSIQIFDK